MSNAMRERLLSNSFNVAIFRNPETETKENIMQDFLDHCEEEFEFSNEDFADLCSLVQSFLQYDQKKVEAGELEMLQAWKDAVNAKQPYEDALLPATKGK